jgi:microcystin-dependent protein
MAQPYVGEIRMFAGNFAPAGWAFCSGQALPISENEVLFQLIGTTYGGDGEETFNLPNLQSRVPIHMGTGPDGITYQIGEMGGVEDVTLTVQQIPLHNHAVATCSSAANSEDPANHVLAEADIDAYTSISSTPANLNAAALKVTGGSQPHSNMGPFLCINFIISLFGIFPSQT